MKFMEHDLTLLSTEDKTLVYTHFAEAKIGST